MGNKHDKVGLLVAMVIMGAMCHSKSSHDNRHGQSKPMTRESYTVRRGVWCPGWRDLICGTDGVTYWNECMFQAAQASNSDLKEVVHGICETPECDYCNNTYPDFNICANNGHLFNSKCEFECHKEMYPLLKKKAKGCDWEDGSRKETHATLTETFLTVAEKLVQVLNEVTQDEVTLTPWVETFTLKDPSNTIEVEIKKGWSKKFTTFSRMDNTISFYAFNSVTPKMKVLLQLNQFETGHTDFKVKGQGIHYKGSLLFKAGISSWELIADFKPGINNCPRVKVQSLRLVDIGDMVITFTPQLKVNLSHPYVDGVFKEKYVEKITNELWRTSQADLESIGCIYPARSSNKCYNMFTLKVCF